MRTIMATGDNVITAIAVGKECNIITDSVKVFLGDIKDNGKVYWREHQPAHPEIEQEISIEDLDSPRKPSKYEEEHEEFLNSTKMAQGIDIEIHPW